MSLLPDNKRDLIHSIMQLRLHPVAGQIRDLISSNQSSINANIQFVTRRDDAYKKSWKVKQEFSGGILFNLGVHYFDLLFKQRESYEKELEILKREQMMQLRYSLTKTPMK